MELCSNFETISFQDSDDLSNIYRIEMQYKEYNGQMNACCLHSMNISLTALMTWIDCSNYTEEIEQCS